MDNKLYKSDLYYDIGGKNMNILVIHGNELNNNSDKAMDIVKNAINERIDANFREYYLPNDVPYLCRNCYECIYDDSYYTEDKCRFAAEIHEIIQSMKNADALIICASVFSLSEDGHIKSFLNHFTQNLRIYEQGNEKIKSALVISITPKKDIVPPLANFSSVFVNLGIRRVHALSMVVWGKMWASMPVDKQNRCKEQLIEKAEMFCNSL